MFLSSRAASQDSLLLKLQRDPSLAQSLKQHIDQSKLIELIQYVISSYSCSETDAESALNSLIRSHAHLISASLSNRKADTSITIPATTDNPVPKKVPIPEKDPSIDATPANTTEKKVEDVSESVSDDQDSRQQQLINSIKALKLVAADLAKAMYGIELTEENQGKVVTKVIEAISDCSAEQTAETVKSLASPLIGEQ